MSRDPELDIEDILEAIEDVELFIAELTEEQFLLDKKPLPPPAAVLKSSEKLLEKKLRENGKKAKKRFLGVLFAVFVTRWRMAISKLTTRLSGVVLVLIHRS